MEDGRGPAPPEVAAVAALRSASGKSRFEPGTHLKPENVQEFYASPHTSAAAVDGLKGLGFTVRAQSRLAVSFTGPKALFEQVFQTNLTLHRYHPTTGRPSPEGKGAHYTSPGPLPVPESLRPHVERVTLEGGITYW